MKLRTLLACSMLLPACAFGAEKDPISPLPEGQRPGPLVEIQPREGTQPKIMAYLTGMDEGNVDLLMLDGKEKRTLPASSIGAMRFNPEVPKPDTSLKLTEIIPQHPGKKDGDDPRPGFQPGDMKDRFRFMELLHKLDKDLSADDRQEYQRLRDKFNLPDKTTLLAARADARQAFRKKELNTYIETQRKEMKGTPTPTLEESRKIAAGLTYAYELQKLSGREIVDKIEDDLPALSANLPEMRMKRKNMVASLVWDILNHGPE